MKSSKPIALLLLLNLGVFAAILGYVLRSRIAAPLMTAASPQLGTAATPGITPSVPGTEIVVVTNQLQWAQLESEDYKTYVARLRSIGCPEETIRDIIIADLDKLLAPEIAAANGRRKDLQYWHPEEAEVANDVDPHQAFLKQREIDKRKREIIRELTNADLARERMKVTGNEDYYERRLSFLSEERRTQVRELLERFDESTDRIREKETREERPLSREERAQLRQLKQQREAELAQLLTPQEKEQFELWLSPTANDLRHSMYGMNATEQEFLSVYRARKAFDERWGEVDAALLDSSERAEMEQARGTMEEQILAELGEARYAELKRGQDDDFHLLSALVTRFSLPKEKAAEVYGYKTVALNYRDQVLANASLTPEQKQEALSAIAEETKNSVKAVLGNRAFNHYVQSGQARWMEQ